MRNSPTEEPEAAVAPCRYCGTPATSVDHVVPQSLLQSQRLATGCEIDWRQMIHARVLTVPCCHECNSVLGNRVYPTIEDRRAAIKRRLRRKHARLLAAPRWEPEDVDALGPGMRGYVARCQAQREEITQRLAWPHTR
jgi:hypothetical protein